MRAGGFTERDLRVRWLLVGVVASALALGWVAPIRLAVLGAWITLLGLVACSLRRGPGGAVVTSFGLGVLMPATPPTVLDLLDSM